MVIKHYEVLTGDCSGALSCRATLTIGTANDTLSIAAGFVVRNTTSSVPTTSFTKLSTLADYKNWKQYVMTATQLVQTYRKDAVPQCKVDIDYVGNALYHAAYFASKLSTSAKAACQQFRIVGRCATPAPTRTPTPTAHPRRNRFPKTSALWNRRTLRLDGLRLSLRLIMDRLVLMDQRTEIDWIAPESTPSFLVAATAHVRNAAKRASRRLT